MKMETMLNGLKYKYTHAKAFSPKIFSYVNVGGVNNSDHWVNNTETNLENPLQTFEEFMNVCNEIDEMYN
jgi:hypothetical protein